MITVSKDNLSLSHREYESNYYTDTIWDYSKLEKGHRGILFTEADEFGEDKDIILGKAQRKLMIVSGEETADISIDDIF